MMVWWQSIRFRLPLALSALFLAVMSGFSWIAYREVEEALFAATGERLGTAALQLSVILQSSTDQILERGAGVARHPGVLAHLLGQAPEAAAEPGAILRALWAADATDVRVELRNSAGAPVLSVGGTDLHEATGGTPLPLPPTGIGPLAVVGGVVYVESASPVTEPGSPDGEPSGWVVQRRPVSGGEVVPLLAQLIGPEASIIVGNADGSAWTDLTSSVAGPPIPLPDPGQVGRYDGGGGGGRFGTTSAVPGTPWIIWVEMPDARIVAPARAVLGRMVGVTLLLAGVGTLLAWSLSRRLTSPLVRLARASQLVGGGEAAPQLEVKRADELGQLTLAFNIMTRQVADTHHLLEAKVAERTSELAGAYQSLADAQDLLVRRERLSTLGQLASGVGHELRNPLGVMTNALYYIEMVLQDPPARVGEYLGILRTQVGISEKIISDLLDFARVRPPERAPTSIPALVEEQIRRMGPLDGVHVRRNFDPVLPEADIDAGQVGQVVLNLVMNGVQAMGEDGGTLTVGARAGEGRTVVLEVRDEGDGIPPGNLEKIFEPLFTTRARGIGLGLAVSRTLVTGNQGTLTVRSTEGEGTTFTVTVPAADASSP